MKLLYAEQKRRCVRMDEPTGRYATVNGLRMYYEIHGRGEPILLLHGGAGSTEIFDKVLLPALSKNRKVIASDLQAHGRTQDVDRPMRYETMADDVALLIKHLKLETTDILGYSLGAGVAIRTAIQHPKLIRKLIVISAPCKRNGWYPEIHAAMARSARESPDRLKKSVLYKTYAKIAPRQDDWSLLFSKMGELLKRDYDWSSEVAKLEIPVLIAFGDADSVRPSHMAEFYELLGGGKHDAGWDGSKMPKSRLLVLPGTTHYNSHESPLLAQAVVSFLNE